MRVAALSRFQVSIHSRMVCRIIKGFTTTETLVNYGAFLADIVISYIP